MLNRLHILIDKTRLPHIVLLGTGLRLAWYLLILFTHPEGFWLYDSNEYWNIAWNLHEYGEFSRNSAPPLIPDYFRTPLYPFFIYPTVLFDVTGNSIPLLQILLDAFSCLLICKIVLRLTGSTVYAKSAALLYALHFPALVMSSFVLSETVLLFLLTLFAWLLLRCTQRFTIGPVLWAGFVGGLCVMCKPVTFILVLPVWVFLLWQKKLGRYTLLLGLCFTVSFYAVQFPWMYRNKQLYGHYFNSVLGEHLVFGYHACHIYSLATGTSYAEVKDMLLEKYYRNIDFNPYRDPYAYAKLVEREAYKILWEHKALFLREHFRECIKFFVQPMRGYTAHQLGNRAYTGFVVTTGVVWQVLIQAFLYLVILYYLLLALRRKRKVLPFVFFIVALLMIFCQFNTMPYTDARMRYPFDGLMIVAAGLSLYMIRSGGKATAG